MDYKRVACLYRVSTKMQVEEDDIPMQRIACNDFIKTMPGWKFECEYLEKGVSGYKKKASERDVLMQVRADAVAKKFDVILVFMFDRLGRREDETPFIVEWFDKQGIEIWSTREGQQRFDTRVDKLLNYIRYWQAGGESEKTSIRVKEKQSQMIKDGIYMSGPPPYGYRNVKSGVFSRKGVERKKLEIIPEEALIVRLIFGLATEKGFGGHRIAKHLNERGIPTQKGSVWGLGVINTMLRNPIYMGYLSYNKTSIKKNGVQGRISPDEWILSEKRIDEIAIVSEEQWKKAQKIRWARTPEKYRSENIDYESYPLQTTGAALFVGFIKCGYCGSKMNCNFSTKKRVLKDGTVKHDNYQYYRCIRKSTGGVNCKSPKMCFSRDNIEGFVLEELFNYFDTLKNVDLTEQITKLNKKNTREEEVKLKQLEKNINDHREDIDTLKAEIVKAINKQSSFAPAVLSELITQKEQKLQGFEKEYEKLYHKIIRKNLEYNEVVKLKKMIPIWREEFEKAPIEVKKMLLTQVIEEIIVWQDTIEVKIKMILDEFLKYAKSSTNTACTSFESTCNNR